MQTLKEQMIMNLELKGYSPKTQVAYLKYMRDFTRHFRQSPEKLGEQEIKEYLHSLISQNRFSPSYINSAYSALKFFYVNTLHRSWDNLSIPRIKKTRHLPLILDSSEIKKIFSVTTNLKHRAMLMTTYAAGLRVSETAHLKLSDIDSKRMQIRVEQGKGKKDRYTLLSEVNLNLLRSYWQLYQPHNWLFPGNPPDKPISTRSIERVFELARQKANIKKKVSIHTLRHSFATHLLEAGTDVYHIQQLMGHASVKTTSVYIHLRNQDALKVSSPLDMLFKQQHD